MSTHYTTEPPPTATALLHTTAGPLTLSLFAAQTPLTCRNFLQHLLDGYYNDTLFHRVVPGFVIQAGDPTATGEGGESIYEERELETYDAEWARLLGREKGEKIVFGDELHSRLRFGRRGLMGMAKGTGGGGPGGGYGSQFFITLGDCRAELDGKCTMFGRVEGDGIYNVVKISEGELVEGTERPRYPFRITGGEVLQMPKGEVWEGVRRRQRVVPAAVTATDEKKEKKKGVKKKAAGKSLLSFGDEGDEDADGMAVKRKKAKFNTKLIRVGEDEEDSASMAKKTNGTFSPTLAPHLPSQMDGKKGDEQQPVPQKPRMTSHRQRKSPSPVESTAHSQTTHRRKPSFHDPITQLPLKDPESPSNSPSPSPPPSRTAKASTSTLNAEIAALKASMRRDIAPAAEPKKKKSALEDMIPSTSVRGRKRPRPGDPGAGLPDASTIKILDAFKAKLEGVDRDGDVDMVDGKAGKTNGHQVANDVPPAVDPAGNEDDEAALCDLHFIANCQSCSNWDRNGEGLEGERGDEKEDDADWMKHALSFAKDRLGKDLTWKRKNEEELVVIDPREREKEIKGKERERRRGGGGGRG
jgi:peptidyl-prolyl cis-trans isomerase SDCCAG10